MKIAIVPAQITTVEDKITSNLTITQLLLLALPLCLCGLVYALPPSMFTFTKLKVTALVMLCPSFCLMAIRAKGKLLIEWVCLISKYQIRPRIYVSDKSDSYLRTDDTYAVNVGAEGANIKNSETVVIANSKLHPEELLQLHDLLSRSQYSLAIKINKNGGLNVIVEEK